MVAGRGRREARGGARNCSLVWSARLYGQFSLDKTLTLQVGSNVVARCTLQELHLISLACGLAIHFRRL